MPNLFIPILFICIAFGFYIIADNGNLVPTVIITCVIMLWLASKSDNTPAQVLFGGFAVLYAAIAIYKYPRNIKQKEQDSLERENVIEKYTQFLNISRKAKVVHYIEGFPYIDEVYEKIAKTANGCNMGINRYLYVWIEGDSLKYQLSILKEYNEENYKLMNSCLFNNRLRTLPSGEIKNDDILVFSRFGDLYTKTSGGGYDLGGAIAGGVIAGGAGAIIGSRQEISSSQIDERKTVVVYRDNNNVRNAYFDSQDFDVFLKLMPDKEMSVLTATKQQKQGSRINEEIDISQKIEKLNDLKLKGLITEEEFYERKKQMLDAFTAK